MTEKYFKMDKETEKHTINYYKISESIKELNKQKSLIREILVKKMIELKLKKIENQEYTILYTEYTEDKLETKKLKEEMYANHLNDMYDGCISKNKRTRLTVKKRSGSEIF